MCRKWKKTAALGLAVLIGGMMPMSTMLAAEDNTEVVQEMETDSVSDVDEVWDGEGISGENESVNGEVNADDGNTVEEANADDENADDVILADVGENADQEVMAGIELMAATGEPEAGDVQVQEDTDAPVISITWKGQSYIYDMGGTIEYLYVKESDQMLECSASQDGKAVSFSYYLDEVTDITAEPKRAEEITWPDEQTSAWVRILSRNANYVLYVKAVGKNGQIVYARSGGIVVDTTPPEIVGVEEGKIYPAGTAFTVSDANLDVVMVNETPTAPESDGNYRVRANGTSCVIRAKDKAGNEKTCSITVSGSEEPGTGEETPGTGEETPGTGEETPGTGEETPGTGEETPGTGEETPGTGEETPGTGEETPGTGEETPETNTVISASGVYALKAGVKYHLAAGNWKIDGDKSVYQGDIDFYVKEDGDYKFSK